MALARIVKFIWSHAGFLPEPEPVYFHQADLAVVAPRGESEVLIRVIDPEKRIWATLGLSHEEAERLSGQLQIAIAAQEV